MGLRWRSFVMENTKAQLSRISKMMSENNRTQIASLLQSVWNQVSEDIQASRNLSEEEINATLMR